MSHWQAFFTSYVSKYLIASLLALLPTCAASGQAVQYRWPNQPQPFYSPQSVIHQPVPGDVPPGSTTRVLPDGRIAIITPFTEEQKREIKRREAERLRIRAIRTSELAKQSKRTGKGNDLYPRLPGEFEKPKALLLSICDWQPHNFNVLLDLIDKTRGHAELLLLYNETNKSNGQSQFSTLIERLVQTGNDYRHVRFLDSNLDTIWLRDFGPRLAETEDGNAMVLDFFYDTIRPQDDEFPATWANLTGATHNQVPWSMQGGNLLANGRGLAIVTSRLFEDNRIYRPGKDYQQNEVYVKQQLMEFCNIKELAVLKPLEHESTRHADMFATFLAPDLVLVAQLDPRLDSQNANILNHNAQLLSRMNVDGRPLRVERIWIPPRRFEHWSAYTNIILTDRLVLIPTYQSDPPAYIQEAIKIYQRLLPQHHVATIDMTSMDKLGGSLHCLSCTIPSFARLPSGIQTFPDAASKNKRSPFVNKEKFSKVNELQQPILLPRD